VKKPSRHSTCSANSTAGIGISGYAVRPPEAHRGKPRRPKIIADLNGQEVKLVKMQLAFPCYRHDNVEEKFLVWRDRFRASPGPESRIRARPSLFVVPCGVEHHTAAEEAEAEVIPLDPVGVANTGTSSTKGSPPRPARGFHLQSVPL
jgi:hypothetical protein